MEKVVCIIAIRHGAEILLVQKRGRFQLPGGKCGPKESYLGCLHRECLEELPGMCILEEPVFYRTIGPYAYTGYPFSFTLYLGKMEGNINAPRAISESVTAALWWTPRENSFFRLTRPTQTIVRSLVKEGYFPAVTLSLA